jgi:hypothetical protein
MFTLIRSLPTRQLLLEQFPAFAVSFVIAELFYKFHSFTLECMAFLITWYVLDAAINFLKNIRKP